MDRKEIRARVLDLLKTFARKLPSGFEITDDSSLMKDLEIDSADLIELALSIEDRFSIEVPDSALPELLTLRDVVDYIERNLPSK